MIDDFDEEDDLDLGDTSFDDFDGGGGEETTLGKAWRENPLIKYGIIGGAVVAIVGGIYFMSGEKVPETKSFVKPAADVKAPPGTGKASTQAYVEAVKEKNEQRIEEAELSGGSAFPTPIEAPTQALDIAEDVEDQEDPLQRWRAIQEERLKRELEQTRVLEGPVVDGSKEREDNIKNMAGVMSEQMQGILEGQHKSYMVNTVKVTDPGGFYNLMEEKANEGNETGTDAKNSDSGASSEEAEPPMETITLLPAGEIVYGQLITEANSDVPGPVLAQIASGPLRGSRILGSFSTQNDLIMLEFTTVVYNDESLDVSAVAIDPDTTLSGMATEVDHRYFKRIILPMAAAFVEGAATAISKSGKTTVSIQGETVAEETQDSTNEQEVSSGIEEAGAELRDILDEMHSGIETLVRIESGTPLGILFTEPVTYEVEATVDDKENN